MIEDANQIYFEHPLNEKMRTWLRLEFLLDQLFSVNSLTETAITLTFFRNISDLLEMLERGEVRSDLLKDLERQQQKLTQWAKLPGIDSVLIAQLHDELKQRAAALMAAPRLGQELRLNKLINVVRQRLSIPGGCCGFDLPTLHLWLHLPQPLRDNEMQEWLTTLYPLHQALVTLMSLVRRAGTFRLQTSTKGFFQDNAEGAELLRLRLMLVEQLYPQISGIKNRFAIRFLPLDSEMGIVPDSFEFALACC